MKIELLSHTENPELVVAIAGRLCYSNKSVQELIDTYKDDPVKIKQFIKELISSGHESPLEHASYTFSIEGVSRVFLAQITRHRLASYSVRSCRYCDMSQSAKTVPESIKNNKVGEELETLLNYKVNDVYNNLLLEGVPKEDARYILPESTQTSMIVTMNARELRHFFNLRCCVRAQWEIREVANKMLELVKEVSTALFEDAGASCVQFGYCPEGKRSCGKVPTLQDIMTNYKEKQR